MFFYGYYDKTRTYVMQKFIRILKFVVKNSEKSLDSRKIIWYNYDEILSYSDFGFAQEEMEVVENEKKHF